MSRLGSAQRATIRPLAVGQLRNRRPTWNEKFPHVPIIPSGGIPLSVKNRHLNPLLAGQSSFSKSAGGVSVLVLLQSTFYPEAPDPT